MSRWQIYEVVKDADGVHCYIKRGEIVRCKECRHRNERCGMGEHKWCEMLNMSTTPDDFCSYGERREP